jgi:tyrosine-protein kinase Etk/Wzc
MNSPNPQYSIFTTPSPLKSHPNWGAILLKYLYYWPLFIITLSITLTAGYFFQHIAKPHYELKATLLIQDQKKSPDQQTALREIDLINPSKLIENEMEVLKSKQLIGQVINDLNLSISYQKKDGFLSYSDLYNYTPVKLILITRTPGTIIDEMVLVIDDKKSFTLLSAKGPSSTFEFNKVYHDDLGTWKVEATEVLPKFKGKTLKIVITDPDKMALQYQKAIDVILSNKLSTAVSLGLNDEVEQRGKDILNSLMRNYNLAASKAKDTETQSTINFLDQRIDSLKGDLAGVEKQLENFKSARGLTDLSDDSKVSLQKLQTNDGKLNDVNVQLNIIKGVEKYINSPESAGRAPSTMGITDQALTISLAKLAELEGNRETLLGTTPETNPQFEPINKQIALTKASIKENVKNIKSTLQNAKQQLQSFNSTYESSIKNIPLQEREYINIQRQQETKVNLYTYLLRKREELAVSYAATLPNDRIVDVAYTSSLKKGQKTLIFALSFFLGLALPVGFVYSKKAVQNKITDVKEITLTGIPVIGEISFSKSKAAIVVARGTSDIVSEQFRSLRAKLYHVLKQKGRVMLLTSSIAGEGKSFVSGNLALVLALAERKTVVIELDLRKPKLAQAFNLPEGNPGITDYLLGNASTGLIIQKHPELANLSIISSGSAIDNPSELIEQSNLKNLIQFLRENYDDVIIDSPPVHLVTDAIVLSSLADITLYVVRQGYTSKSELDFINEMKDKDLLNNIQVVFNSIQRIKHGYGYKFNNSYYNKA